MFQPPANSITAYKVNKVQFLFYKFTIFIAGICRHTNLQVDEVLTDESVSLSNAGLVESSGLLLCTGAVLWWSGPQDGADDVLVPLVYRLIRIV